MSTTATNVSVFKPILALQRVGLRRAYKRFRAKDKVAFDAAFVAAISDVSKDITDSKYTGADAVYALVHAVDSFLDTV